MAKKIFIIAGEASGDVLGSKLMWQLKEQYHDIEFSGIGGQLMQQQGLDSIIPMEELSVMGFFEILPHIPKLLKYIAYSAKEIERQNPDCVITIDAPDFCFRVVEKLKNYQGKKIHFIAPSVWAYRENRAQKVAKLYDLLLTILPFEPPYFEKYGLKSVFVGHPIVENAPDLVRKEKKNIAFRLQHKININDKVLCVTPGSRNGEVLKIFPIFIEVINNLGVDHNDLTVVIPIADKTRHLVTQMAQSIKVPYVLIEKEEKESMFFASNCALAKSGTNTIELSLYHIPMVIAYKVNALSYMIIKKMAKIRYVNLINIISNKEIIPEMIQSDCNCNKIFYHLKRLIENEHIGYKQIEDSALALEMMGLGSKNASKVAAQEILKII